MTIFALFMCIQATRQCQMVEPERIEMGIYSPARTFATLADCQAYPKRMGVNSPVVKGKITGYYGTWFECRSKHVETWEAAR